MNPTRRGFLGLLPALMAGATAYFDMGAAWQKQGRVFHVGDVFQFSHRTARGLLFHPRYYDVTISIDHNELWLYDRPMR